VEYQLGDLIFFKPRCTMANKLPRSMGRKPAKQGALPFVYLVTGVVALSFVGGDKTVAGEPACYGDGIAAGRLKFGPVAPMPQMNARFQREEDWIGADGVYSVALSQERTLWLFSDTSVGSVRNGKRVNATIVNNSVAVQDGLGEGAKLRFFIRRTDDKKPVALIAPADKRGWFWLQAGARLNGRLYLFLSQVEKTQHPGVFGFRQIGQWLGIVTNFQDEPTSWRVEQRKLPFTLFSPQRSVSFGAAVVSNGEYLYVFGTDEDKPHGQDRYLIVARVPVATVADFTSWRFYREGRWDSDSRSATRLVGGMASECSVSYLSRFKCYVLVYTDHGLSPRILARTATTPWGPWSEATTLYRCPEMDGDKRVFCYAAKAHLSQSTCDELVVSYVTNSFDFWHVAANAKLYWPRFIRVKLQSDN
jgi:hypothetical protein